MTPKRLHLILLAFATTSWVRADLATNLVAYWDFEGTADNHSSASGGAAYHGTLVGNAAVTGGTALAGTGSLVLDGDGDYLDVATIVDVNQAWTASAWYRPDLAPAGTARMMVFETSGNNSFAISFGLRESGNPASTNHQTVVDTTPTNDLFGNRDIADTLTAETWNHVALAFTPATATVAGSVVTYINGLVSQTLVIPAGSTLIIPDSGFHVGTYRNADGRWFDGSIDEVAIWNRTLSRNDVTELYERGAASLGLTADLAAAGKAFVSVESSDPALGETFGTGLYDLNESVLIEAVPKDGSLFTGWSAPFGAEPDFFNLTVTASVTLTAGFAQDTADPDADGLTNYQEIVLYFTDPDLADTDSDQISDGDEVLESLTNPLVSQLNAVNWIAANLGGGTEPGDIVLTRDSGTNTLSFKLKIDSSETLQSWGPLLPAATSSSGVAAGLIAVSFPPPWVDKGFFRVVGEAP
ncbi:MAG: LamG domain-containing protein [Akkermansiaceae bacterium]|jgi:hypothetical protein|nr:LamG domain-containing protein [Akkermansiaceae bacterium]